MKGSIASVLLPGFLVLASCAPVSEVEQNEPQGSEQQPSQTSPIAQFDPQPALSGPDAAAGDELATGVLIGVDIAERTFRLRAEDGSEQIFQYSDSTSIGGVSGTQGLGTEEGRQAKVVYDSTMNPPTALSVEIDSFD